MQIKNIIDNQGNEIKQVGNKILLYLASGEKRLAGTIVGDTIEMIRDARHLMKVNNSYGFNYNLISSLDDDIVIKIVSSRGKEKGRTTVGKIKQNGTYLHFLSQGFEKQIFLRIDLFN